MRILLQSIGLVYKLDLTITRVKSRRLAPPTIGAQKQRASTAMPNTRTVNSDFIVIYLVYELIEGFQINILRSRSKWFAEDIKVRVASERHNSTRTRYNMYPVAVEEGEINKRII